MRKYGSFCENNGWLMEKMNKGLTVKFEFEEFCVLLKKSESPKNWVLINYLKIPQMPQNLSSL